LPAACRRSVWRNLLGHELAFGNFLPAGWRARFVGGGRPNIFIERGRLIVRLARPGPGFAGPKGITSLAGRSLITRQKPPHSLAKHHTSRAFASRSAPPVGRARRPSAGAPAGTFLRCAFKSDQGPPTGFRLGRAQRSIHGGRAARVFLIGSHTHQQIWLTRMEY